MRRFIWILVVLFASVWLGLKISQDPGYALFVYRQWTVEMPLWVAFVGLILLLLLFYFFLRFFDGIETLWLRCKNWLRLQKKYKSYSKTNRGLIELLEGDWKNAEHYLLAGAPQSDTAFVNYIAAARAAHEVGAYDRRDLYLQKAHDVLPQANVAIGLARAQMQLSQGQLEQALATLKGLRLIAPRHKLVLKLLEKLYIRLSDWDELFNLLPSLRKAKLITYDQQENFESHIYKELLNNISNEAENVYPVRDIWQNIPRRIQKNPEVILAYIKKLLPFAHTGNEIAELIEFALKKQWNEEMVILYGLITTDNPKHQLTVSEDWLKRYGYRAALFLTLGRLCQRCQLWGKARSYFEQSLKANADPQAYLEYGKLLEHLGEGSAALENYKQGLGAMVLR